MAEGSRLRRASLPRFVFLWHLKLRFSFLLIALLFASSPLAAQERGESAPEVLELLKEEETVSIASRYDAVRLPELCLDLRSGESEQDGSNSWTKNDWNASLGTERCRGAVH